MSEVCLRSIYCRLSETRMSEICRVSEVCMYVGRQTCESGDYVRERFVCETYVCEDYVCEGNVCEILI